MANEQAEVRLRLTADDQASASIAKLSEGLLAAATAQAKTNELLEKHVGLEKKDNEEAGKKPSKEKEADAAKALGGWLQVGAIAAAAVAAGMAASFYAAEKLANASLEAADAERQQVKAMSGVLMLIDGGAHSMAQLRAVAGETHEELEEMALKMGVAATSVDEAFESMMERGQISSARAKELTEDMVVVGKIVRGGMDSLAQGFSMMELGMVRAKNPIVQLIAATHTLKGNAHAVAAALQKMTPERQMEVAEKAIKKQAELLRAQGPQMLGMDALKTSFEGFREMFLKSAGQPLLEEVLPALNQVQRFLVDHSEEIKAYGHRLGEELERGFLVVKAVVEGIYQGIHQDWDFISSEMNDVFGLWYRAWQGATGDTESIKNTFASITDDFVRAFTGVAHMMKLMAELAMEAGDLLSGNAIGTNQLKIEEEGARQVATNASSSGDQKEVDAALQRVRDFAATVTGAGDAANAYTDQLRAVSDANMKAADDARMALDQGNYDAFNAYLQKAVDNNIDGAEQFAFSTVAASQEAQKALLAGKIHIAGGMDELMKMIREKSPELAGALQHALAASVGEKGIAAPKNLNFTGDIHIHQDFKNEDPERVAVILRRDLSRAAESRVQSRLATAFGG